jgi:hypothetical protein
MHDIKASCKWKVEPFGLFVIKDAFKIFLPLDLALATRSYIRRKAKYPGIKGC